MDEDSVYWDDSYSVGFGLIDNQHKELVRMTNSLFESCKRGSGAADAAFMKTVRSAVEYAQTHFYTEEKYMKQTNYPDFDAHKQEHESFVTTVIGAVKNFEKQKSDPFDLARFLKQWLLNHIAKVDKKYAPYLAGVE
jgi:hemerythrin-like metal-binding protein